MNRIFHARIAWYQYFLLIVLGANAFGFLWCKYILLAVFMMLLLIVVIEQVIHTTYTVTPEGELILSYGRFTRKKTIQRYHFHTEAPFDEIRPVFSDGVSAHRVRPREICIGNACQRTGIHRVGGEEKNPI